MRPGLREERGAISIMAGLSLVVVIFMTALGVDIGAAQFDKRDLQKVVDLAAVDAVHAVGDQRPVPGDPETISERALRLAQESADRNNFDWAETGLGNSIGIELGIGDPTTREFTPLAAGADESTANSVRVSATTLYDYRFVPGSIGMSTDAVAIGPRSPLSTPPPPGPTGGTTPPDPPTGCQTDCGGGGTGCETECDDDDEPPIDGLAEIVVGSRVARLDSSDAELFNETLTGLGLGPAELDVAGYEGLAAADLTLGELWAELGLGSADEVASSDVTLGDLVDASIDALDAKGDGVSLVASAALQDLRASAGGSFDPTLDFTFGEAVCFGEACVPSPVSGGLGISTPGEVAGATLSVLDLVFLAAEVANGDNLLSVEVPETQVPGVQSGTVSIGLIERPSVAVGPVGHDADGNWVTRAQTAQARIQVDLTLDAQVLFGVVTEPIRLPIYFDAGSATAELTGLGCTSENLHTPEDVWASVRTTTSAVNAYVGSVAAASLTNPGVAPEVEDAVFAMFPPDVEITGFAQESASGVWDSYTFSGPFDARLHRVGASNLGLGPGLAADLDVSVSGSTTPAEALLLITQVKAAVSDVLATIDETLFEPLADALGIKIAGADVANPWLACSAIELID